MNYVLRLREQDRFEPGPWSALDPGYLADTWEHRREILPMFTIADFLAAFGWFSLCVPIIQVAWILSKGGRRRFGMHLLICAFAISGSLAELLGRLMTIGIESAADWISRYFNLDNWLDEDSGDGLGWRVLEVANFLTTAIVIWIDAFMWFALSGILITIFFSVRSDKEENPDFGRRWSIFGLIIGVLSLIDFFAFAFSFGEFGYTRQITMYVSLTNSVLFLPAWLIILSYQLPKASAKFESDADPTEREPMVENGGFSDEIELS